MAPRPKRPANIWRFTLAATPPNILMVVMRGSRGRQAWNVGWFSLGIFTQAMGELSHAFGRVVTPATLWRWRRCSTFESVHRTRDRSVVWRPKYLSMRLPTPAGPYGMRVPAWKPTM